MKKNLLIIILFLIPSFIVCSQDKPAIPAHPTFTGTGKFLGVSKALRDIPAMSAAEFKALEAKAHTKQLNEKLKYRNYPFASTAFPKGKDAAWQDNMGSFQPLNDNPLVNFDGQTSPYYPPDCNGTVGPDHYMQTINCVYAIYDKAGTLVAGPTNMNQLFGNVPGSNYNDGDPIILYDEQADRYVATEFSITGSTDYILMAVSTTNDPTGTWYQYSFQVASMPDYPKFSVWRDGYYMGDNNSSSNDIYVFERTPMLTGATARSVGFNNAWRPSSVDGFMCVPPVDNDGAFAPAGSPGLYIAFNDDAFGGGTDQLWIYELHVDWTNTSASTFVRSQQLDVIPFDCNFGNNWNNITQPGTSQKVDAIPQVIMNAPQYRNFGEYQTIVCCHTVDVDATNHAGIRWYELRRDTGEWSVRQTGTYSPDIHNRWMGSIMLNDFNQIALAYSISSTTEYPGIRFCGQSPSAYASGNGILDIAEDTILVGTASQTGVNRWGDYALLSIDPSDDKTFWFTTQYIGSGGSRKTRIASFRYITNPTATTSRADMITGTSARLKGIINPEGQATSYYFKYGLTSGGLNDSTQVIPAGSGMDTLHVAEYITGLTVNTVYYYQAVASFASGVSYGTIMNLTTLNEAAMLEVEPPVQNVELTSGNTWFSVTANTTWTVTHTAPWTTLLFSGSGSDTIDVAFAENNTPFGRTDTLTVTSEAGTKQVLVYQAGIAPILTVLPPNADVSMQAGETKFEVTSNIPWNAVSDSPWCTLNYAGDSITAMFTTNEAVGERVATITVDGGILIQTATVTQAGIAPSVSVIPPVRNVNAAPGSVTFDVISNTGWTVTSNALWCNVTPSGNGNGTITAEYAINTSSETRSALIDVTVIGLPPVQVSVVQTGPNGIEDLQANGFRIFPNPASSSITFTAGMEEWKNATIKLLDINGREILVKTLNGNDTQKIDVSGLEGGLYQVIVISTANNTAKGKLVIRN